MLIHREDHLRAIDCLLRNAFVYLTGLVSFVLSVEEITGEGYVQTWIVQGH